VTKKGLPKDVIDQWPEVFNDVDVKAVPLAYLHSMRIIFEDGKVWDLNIASHVKKNGVHDLEEHIQELISTYEESIEHIDFRLDVDRVKKDIMKKTKSFLKKPKQK
jgi:predicted component of type VI protein secretion system